MKAPSELEIVHQSGSEEPVSIASWEEAYATLDAAFQRLEEPWRDHGLVWILYDREGRVTNVEWQHPEIWEACCENAYALQLFCAMTAKRGD